MSILFIIWISLLILGLIGLISRKGNLGINTNTVNCPSCGLKLPILRTPTSMQQFFLGGWSCSKCGCEMDKWGKKISTTIQTNPRKLEALEVKQIIMFDKKGKTPVERVFEEDNR